MAQHAHAPAPTKPGPIVFSDRQMLEALRRLSLGKPTLGRALELAGLVPTEQPSQLQGTTTK